MSKKKIKANAGRHGWANKPRRGEKLGAGYFLFMRDVETNRISAPVHPYEHPDHASVKKEVKRLAKLHPGKRIEAYKLIGAVCMPEK